jgi:hypothetical protein
MDKKKIIQSLKENGLSEIEDLKYEGDALVLRFFYDFDEPELDSARAYANDESNEEEEGDIWYDEFFKPYLSDLAVDNVGEIIEEIMDKFDIDAQYISYEIDEDEYSYNEFIGLFSEKGKDFVIEDVLEEMGL